MQPVFHVQLDFESFVGNNIYFFRIKRHQFTAACRQRYWALYEGLSVTERLVVVRNFKKISGKFNLITTLKSICNYLSDFCNHVVLKEKIREI